MTTTQTSNNTQENLGAVGPRTHRARSANDTPRRQVRAAGKGARRARFLAGGVAVLAAALVAILAAGCQTSAQRTTPSPHEDTLTDPCADRLHDLCGRLLLYYSLRGEMPESLDDLASVDTAPMPPLVCPASGWAYAYNKDGLVLRGVPGRILVYDAVPAHGGMRWCIVADAAEPDQPLAARILQVPGSVVFPAARADRSPLPAMTPPAKR
jgi:hypothetical protein